MISDPITIKNWSNNFKISYNGNDIIKKEQIINNDLLLKIAFVDDKENIINKNINLKIMKSKSK